MCECVLTVGGKQGVRRAKGCRMSVIEAVWDPEEAAKRAKAAAAMDAPAPEAVGVSPAAGERVFSGYLTYTDKERDAVRVENPDFTPHQVVLVLGERWKAMTDAERAPYEAEAARQKQHEEEEQAKKASV